MWNDPETNINSTMPVMQRPIMDAQCASGMTAGTARDAGANATQHTPAGRHD
jgi:hypothetical protein